MVERLKKGGLWPRIWLILAAAALGAVLLHGDSASEQGEYVLEAAILGAFMSIFLPWMFQRNPRKLLIVLASLVTAAAVLIPVGCSVLSAGLKAWEKEDLRCETPERYDLFGGRNVMIFVPHADDDLLMMGGVIEEYVRTGSTVSLVYSCNGDYALNGETRLREALKLAEKLGIDEENVYFLGYGDGWQSEYGTMFLAPDDEELVSATGHTAAWGLEEHPAVSEGTAYSRSAFRNDIRTLLDTNRPDTVFCIDTDPQYEHRTLSFLFEEALGELLREEPDYDPVVLKGFAYSTAWTADAFADNTPSGTPLTERMTDNVSLRGADAILFPTENAAVSCLSPEFTELADELSVYASQDAVLRADRVMRTDRAFFLRRTDSLLYDGEYTSSSGDAGQLTDFIVSCASDSFYDLSPVMGDNGWFPETGSDRTAVITLPETRLITSLAVYDAPSAEDNVLSCRVVFSDGTEVTLQPDSLGGRTEYVLPEPVETDSLTVILDSTEGEHPGLTELEAFGDEEAPEFPLVRLTNNGTFASEIMAEPGETIRLEIYLRDTDPGEVTFLCDNPSVTITPVEGGAEVLCPEGEIGRISLCGDEGVVLDSVAVFCPSGLFRTLCRHADSFAHLSISGQWDQYRWILHTAENLLRGINP